MTLMSIFLLKSFLSYLSMVIEIMSKNWNGYKFSESFKSCVGVLGCEITYLKVLSVEEISTLYGLGKAQKQRLHFSSSILCSFASPEKLKMALLTSVGLT